MLTNDDLNQIEKITKKTVRSIVREEVEAEGENIRTELGSDIRMAGIRTASEIQETNTRLKNLEVKTSRIEKGIVKLQKGLKKASNFLDRENMATRKRVRVIEEHLGIEAPII